MSFYLNKLQTDLENQDTKNNNSRGGSGDQIRISTPKSQQQQWPISDLVHLATEQHKDDSGHFTASPDQSGSGCSGSSRGHSPNLCQSEQTETLLSPTNNYNSSAALVLQACRESKPERLTKNNNSDMTSSEMQNQKQIVTEDGGSSRRNYYPSTSGRKSAERPKSSGYLREALDNFNELYQEKLRIIDKAGAQGDSNSITNQTVMDKKVNILECWAKDVCVQNIVLIHTIEELERQGEQKLKMLQEKVNESSSLSKKHLTIVESYEHRIRTLLKDNKASKEDQKALKRDLDKIRTEFQRIRIRTNDLEKDNDGLVTLVSRIRDMGVWDIDGLELHKRTFAQIFELYPNLPGSEVQTVFTREKLRSIRENEDRVQELESEITVLKACNEQTKNVVTQKDSKIVELEQEIQSVSGKLQNCQVQCEHYKSSLIDTQEKLLEATKELQVRNKVLSRPSTPNDAAAETARHAEIQELLLELRNVKTQLHMSVQESQSAKEETNMIRREFSDRLRAMQESQQCLHSEFSHSLETHSQIQEKEAELQKIKEQMNLFQSKSEATEKQLSDKNKLIEDLQSTIEELNSKKLDGYCKAPEFEIFENALNAKPTVIHCGRDHHQHYKGKLHQDNCRSCNKLMNNRNEKPPWNHHFTKSNDPKNATSGPTSISHSKTQPSNCTKSKAPRKNTINVKKLQAHELNSNYSHQLLEGFNVHNLESTNDKHDGVTLPRIPGKYSNKINRKNPVSNHAKPKIISKNKKISFQEKDDAGSEKPPFACGHNSSPTDTEDLKSLKNNAAYGLLMQVAVETSKRLLDELNESKNNQFSSFRVIAGHKHHHHHKPDEKTEAATTFSYPKSKRNNNAEEYSSNSDEMLSQLPEQSSIYTVNDWIEKSSLGTSSSSSSNKLIINQKPPPGRNNDPRRNGAKGNKSTFNKEPIDYQNLKLHSTSGSSKPSYRKSPPSAKDIYAMSHKVDDISDIKQEWHRIFSNIGDRSNDAGDFLAEEAENLAEGMVKRVTFEDPDDSEGSDISDVPECSPTDVNLSSPNVEVIRKEFEAEKAKLKEDHLKELRERDIEIKMQKVTIKHLQDALVAMKKGQPCPVPNSSANANGINGGKVYEI